MKKLRLVKMLVQPVVVSEDDEGFLDGEQMPAFELAARDFPAFVSEGWPRRLAEHEAAIQKIDAAKKEKHETP